MIIKYDEKLLVIYCLSRVVSCDGNRKERKRGGCLINNCVCRPFACTSLTASERARTLADALGIANTLFDPTFHIQLQDDMSTSSDESVNDIFKSITKNRTTFCVWRIDVMQFFLINSSKLYHHFQLNNFEHFFRRVFGRQL